MADLASSSRTLRRGCDTAPGRATPAVDDGHQGSPKRMIRPKAPAAPTRLSVPSVSATARDPPPSPPSGSDTTSGLSSAVGLADGTGRALGKGEKVGEGVGPPKVRPGRGEPTGLGEVVGDADGGPTTRVGEGDGEGDGRELGDGRGSGDGSGEGSGLGGGLGEGSGGGGGSVTTRTTPVIPLLTWIRQKYVNSPSEVNVREYDVPGWLHSLVVTLPQLGCESNWPGAVTLCGLPPEKTQRTVSPTPIVTSLGW